MATTVTLPRYLTDGASFTAAIVGNDRQPKDTAFCFDFTQLEFVNGSGLTAFCNTLEWLSVLGVGLSFSGHRIAARAAIEYLDDCGFFGRYLGQSLRTAARSRSTTLPFQPVAHADAFSWLEHTFTPWMSRVLSVSPSALGSLKSCIKEVFNNIQDHSSANTGFVHVQHYPRMDEVRVTMSDFGKGIPANVRRYDPALDDGKAILRATDEGFTTRSVATNRGVGLSVLVDCITGMRGTVEIWSLGGGLRCRRIGKDLTRICSIGNGNYPGTLVEFSLSIVGFIGDDPEEEDATW
jgi:hypothetical protein